MPTHRSFPPPRYQTKKQALPLFTMQSFYLAIIGVGVLGYVGVDAVNSLAPTINLSGACNIKGNVSINSGERIYHIPGQKFYAETKISPQYGERWFCSEAEARAAGWRKASR
ncbi:hypothetical protein [Rhizobium sp. P32RR-XVIII]|uniref:sunset domain-containing protein n=1 Tax=Rhizobium sp. P32RR-XVIII TaxID=2726738 RepID=UPI001FEF0D2B|nr:hypothetical protein [Rhizobium sp. P32RR-XVIII]